MGYSVATFALFCFYTVVVLFLAQWAVLANSKQELELIGYHFRPGHEQRSYAILIANANLYNYK